MEDNKSNLRKQVTYDLKLVLEVMNFLREILLYSYWNLSSVFIHYTMEGKPNEL